MKQAKSKEKRRTGRSFATHAPAKTNKTVKNPTQKSGGSGNGFTETDGALITRALFTVEGVAILEWNASFPLPTTHGVPQTAKKGLLHIADFYRRLAEESDRYARGGLLTALTRQYENDPDPRKRYRHARVRLSVTHTVTEGEGEFYSVLRRVTLSRAGKTIAVREEGEVFDRKRGRLCPLSRLRRAGFVPRPGEKEKAAKSGFYLLGGAICFPRTEIS